MAEESVLERINHINLLFDFYGQLLTNKQQMFLQHYYQDNYTLSEIAEAFAVSRQAIFEHISRAEQSLEDYEAKLQLLEKHMSRTRHFNILDERLKEMNAYPGEAVQSKVDEIHELVKKLRNID